MRLGRVRGFCPQRDNRAEGADCRGENAGNPLFFVARGEKPASLSIVERESGGESDTYECGPIQKRETKNTNRPRR